MVDRDALAKIKVVFCDVDGVLTDGGLYHFGGGSFAVRFSAQDGFGIKRAMLAGLQIVWVTGRGGSPVQMRAHELGITRLYEAVQDKPAVIHAYLKEHGLSPEQAVFIGDDVPDIEAMKLCGLGIVVQNASAEARSAADWEVPRSGGDGAVRYVLDRILMAREGLPPV